MALDFREIVLLGYSGPQGNVSFPNALNASISSTRAQNRVMVMKTGDRNIGHTSGSAERSVTFSVKEVVGSSLGVDWELAFEENERFDLRAEYGVNGKVQNFIDCRISDLSHSYDAEGDASMDLTVSVTNTSLEGAL